MLAKHHLRVKDHECQRTEMDMQGTFCSYWGKQSVLVEEGGAFAEKNWEIGMGGIGL